MQPVFRDVAQPGSALRSGRRGREFESRHPDLIAKQPHMAAFFQWHILFISYKVASMEDFILALLIILRDGLLNTIQETQNQPGLTDPGE